MKAMNTIANVGGLSAIVGNCRQPPPPRFGSCQTRKTRPCPKGEISVNE